MKIQFDIDQKAALKRGENVPGRRVTLDVDPAELSDEQRELLADLLDTESQPPRCSKPLSTDDERVGAVALESATVDGVRAELDRLLQKRREKVAERTKNMEAEKDSYREQIRHLEQGSYYQPGLPLKRAVDYFWPSSPNYGRHDPEAQALWSRVGELRKAEAIRILMAIDADLSRDDSETRAALFREVNYWGPREAVIPNAVLFAQQDREAAKRQEREEAEQQRRQLRALIAEHGTEEQLERFDAGVLPDDEQDDIARKKLFGVFDAAPFQKLTEDDIEHEEGCARDGDEAFGSEVATELSAEAWAALKRLRAQAPEDATIEARRHDGWCRDCGGTSAPRWSARVKRTVAGRSYRQSYALD